MKPRMKTIRKPDAYWLFHCRGHRPDGHFCYGFGHTMEQAYQAWLDYDPTEILF